MKQQQANMYYEQGKMFFSKKHLPEALSAFEKAYELLPNDAKVNDGIGRILHYLGRNDEALDCLKRAVDLNSVDAGTYYLLGYFCHKKHDFDKAIKYYEDAVYFKEDFAIALLNLGICYYETLQLGKTVVAMEKALKIGLDSGGVEDAKMYVRLVADLINRSF